MAPPEEALPEHRSCVDDSLPCERTQRNAMKRMIRCICLEWDLVIILLVCSTYSCNSKKKKPENNNNKNVYRYMLTK